MSEEDRVRLKEIVRTFRACGQLPTVEAVAQQFKYETGRPPFPPDLERVVPKEDE